MGKIAGYNVQLKFGSPLAEKGVFDAKLSQKSDEIDVTDSVSAGDSKEYLPGLTERSISFSMWFKDDEANRLTISQTVPFEMILSGKKYSGTLVITGEDVDAGLKDAVRVSYTARITGALQFGDTVSEPG